MVPISKNANIFSFGGTQVVVLAETGDYAGFGGKTSTALNTADGIWVMTIGYSKDDSWVVWAYIATAITAFLVSILVATIMIQKIEFKTMEKRYLDDLANPQKLRLRLFLQDQEQSGDISAESEDRILHAKPIADLFPNTTVLVADIVGFTAWSSVREPALVFQLLQTIFYSFDKIAKQRGVFKVSILAARGCIAGFNRILFYLRFTPCTYFLFPIRCSGTGGDSW